MRLVKNRDMQACFVGCCPSQRGLGGTAGIRAGTLLRLGRCSGWSSSQDDHRHDAADDTRQGSGPPDDCKASDVLFWLDRNISGESIFDTHGRGMYLIHRLTHRVIVNLWRGKSTELILLHYLNDPPADNKPLAINEF